MRIIATVILSGLIAACATQPRAPAAPAAGADLKGAPKGAVAATSAPVGAAAPAADVVDPNYLKRGYKAVHRNGQLLYCRSEILTGTHFQNTVCLTDAQMKVVDQQKQGVLDQMNKAGGTDCLPKCN